MLEEATREFVVAHDGEDVARLLLSAASYPEVDMKQAARIIEARKKVKRKIPLWYACPSLDYPSSLSLEQCSSQEAALYKQRFVHDGAVVADITGGLGVDSYFLSKKASVLYYFERQEFLCEAAKENFSALNANNIIVTNADCIERTRHYDLIYADPARRAKSSERIYSITDCEPDIYELKDSLLSISDALLVKISPMADISRTLDMFPECCELHIVAVDGEVKELLLYMKKDFSGEARIFAGGFSFLLSEEKSAPLNLATSVGRYIYVPRKEMMKAGTFKLLSNFPDVSKLGVSTHIYTSNRRVEDFPGRCYVVDEILEWNKACAGSLKKKYPRAELTSLNFPLSTDELRKKLKIADGGDTHLFAVSVGFSRMGDRLPSNKKELMIIATHPAVKHADNIDWLFSQIPSYQKVGGKAYKPGLDSMLAFDKQLGSAHKKFRSIHIAGTNGKGSTSHMLAAGLAACGYKVGLYTSPHLKDFRERMRIVEGNSYRLIPEEDVDAFIDRWKPYIELTKPSFFEISTGMAFDYFARENVDIAVIETGLGGRLDSTNIIMPVLSVITNIGLEHCEYLGSTLEQIASEKAGIIKHGVPVVVGEVPPETRPVFEMKAAAESAPLTVARETGDFLGISASDLDLKGDYQQRNIQTVNAAALVLSSILAIDPSRFAEGVASAARISGLHGRWETLREASADGRKAQIICDTGHNAHGMRWIREQIDRICCDYENIFFIFGVMADKDIDSIAGYLPRDVNYIFTQADSPRAMKASDLANYMHDHGLPGRVTFSVSEALSLADSLASDKDLIFIGGSNFVVAEVL